MKRKSAFNWAIPLVVLLLAACSAAQLTSTPLPPATIPPTSVPPTPVPPTATQPPPATIPPTAIPPSPVPPTPLPPTAVASLNPSPRGYAAMAYDEESDRIILFGGVTGNILEDASQYNGETWAYDVTASKWTEMKPATGPGARCCADMTYDSESDRVLLFGGADAFVAGRSDTWAYDFNTNTWQKMKNGPSGYLGCRIAYDAESDRAILFGGYDAGMDQDLNNTWAYDFNSDTWTEMKPSTSPSGRNYHAMAYDAESDRVILWGGEAKVKDPSVWAYDYNQNTWQKMASSGAGPILRGYISMAYNAKADRIILYGGYISGIDETWAYDYNANRWTNLAPATNAGARMQYAMAYSTAADRVVMFGGALEKRFDYTDETWTYDLVANTWSNVTMRP